MAAAATFSCSKNEAFDNTSDNNAISFRPAVGKAVKAADVTLSTFTSFGVTAILSTGDYTGTGGNVYYSDTYTKSSGWGSSVSHYWPIAGNTKLSFFGYYDGALSSIASTGGYPVIADYTVANDAAAQKDLIVASAVNQVKPTNGTDAIELTFKHALSKINISAKVADASYFAKIKSISFVNIYNKGTFTYDGTGTVGAWALSSDNSTGAYTYFTGEKEITSTVSPIYDEEAGKAMMFIPQSKAVHSNGAMEIKVSYDLYVDANGTPVMIDSKIDVPVALNDLAMGKYYRYTLSIPKSGTEIKLEATPEEWGAENGDK